MKTRYIIAKIICKFLPPLLSQSVRAKIISINEGELLKHNFVKKSITGSKFVGNTSDFHAFKFSIHGYFDWRNIVLANCVLKYKNGSIIEVGANIGTETISFCDIAKMGNNKVYAFEPLLDNYERVIANQKLNNLSNLELFDCLVSDTIGEAFFNIPKGNNSGSGFITDNISNENSKKFEVVTLDNKIKNVKVSMISIDVEGFEYQVLKGGEGLIRKNNPALILEVNKKYLQKRGKIQISDFYSYLKNLGYTCYYINRIGLDEVDITNFENKPNKNWLCLHENDIVLKEVLNKSILFNAFNPFLTIKIIY